MEVTCAVLPCLFHGWNTCMPHHAGCWTYDMLDQMLSMSCWGDPHHFHVKDRIIKHPSTSAWMKSYSNWCYYQWRVLVIIGSNLFTSRHTLPCGISVRSRLSYPLIILIDIDTGFLRIELTILLSGNDLTHPFWSVLISQGMYFGDDSVCKCSGIYFLWCEGEWNLVC